MVVVGGTTGIGRGIAEGFAEAGANVVPTSRNRDSVDDAVDSVGSRVNCPTDVTERDEVVIFLDEVEDAYGGVDVLVNSAGVIPDNKRVTEITDDEWQTVVDTNLYGVFLTSPLAPRYMTGENNAILNVGSVMGEMPLKGLTPYTGSKFGVNGLTKNFALEYADSGIRVNAVAPGYVKTRRNEELLADPQMLKYIEKRTPLSRIARLEEVVEASLYLCSSEAGFITGEILTIDGGISL